MLEEGGMGERGLKVRVEGINERSEKVLADNDRLRARCSGNGGMMPRCRYPSERTSRGGLAVAGWIAPSAGYVVAVLTSTNGPSEGKAWAGSGVNE